MSQQINLYEAPPEVNIWRDYSPFPQVAIGLVLLMILGSGYSLWSYWGLQDQLELAKNRQEREAQNIEAIKQQLPDGILDQNLEAEVAELTKKEETTRQLLKALNLQRIGNVGGFSSFMEGLARRSIKGLWLTKIDLNEGGAKIGLQGQTSKPETVPQLIQRLGKEAAFQGTEFNIFNLTNASSGRVMSFDVRAEQETP